MKLLKLTHIHLDHKGVVELLIKNGADINVKNHVNDTALILAALGSNFQNLKQQIEDIKRNIYLFRSQRYS